MFRSIDFTVRNNALILRQEDIGAGVSCSFSLSFSLYSTREIVKPPSTLLSREMRDGGSHRKSFRGLGGRAAYMRNRIFVPRKAEEEEEEEKEGEGVGGKSLSPPPRFGFSTCCCTCTSRPFSNGVEKKSVTSRGD